MKRRARRALSAEEASMTAAQRAEMRDIAFKGRALAQSSSYQRDRAAEKDSQRARQQEPKK